MNEIKFSLGVIPLRVSLYMPYLLQTKRTGFFYPKVIETSLRYCTESFNITEVVITWSHFAGMKCQPVQPGQISAYDYMGKSVFIPARRDRFPSGVSLKKPQIPIDLKMFTKWWNSIKTFVYFFLIDRRHMRRKNTIEMTTIYGPVLLWIFWNWCVNWLFHPA